MSKIIALTLLVCGSLTMFVTFSDLWPFWSNNQTQQIKTLWSQDIELLLRNKKLPKEWVEIKTVEYNAKTDFAKKILEDVKPSFPENPDGKYKLEIDLDDWEENGNYSLMIEYRLYDIASQNLILEFGRTLSQNKSE